VECLRKPQSHIRLHTHTR